MNWFLPAIVACLCWRFGQTLIKRGLSSLSPFISNIFFVIAGLLILIPYALINGVNNVDFPLVLIFGFLSALPNLILPYVIEKGNVSLSGTVLAMYPIITVILSVLFLKESLVLMGWFGV